MAGHHGGGILAGTAFVDVLPNMHSFTAGLAAGMSKNRKVFAASGLLVGGAILGGITHALHTGLHRALEEQKVVSQLEASIKSATKAGSDLGITTEGVVDLAHEIQKYSGIQDDATIAAASWTATFHNIKNTMGEGNDLFDRTIKLSADLGAKMSIATGSTINMVTANKLLSKAVNSPVKGMTALTRAGVQFTEKQKKTIKRLVESGHMLKAQKIILGEVRDQVAGSAKAYGETLPGKIARAREAWGETEEQLSLALLPALTKIGDKLVELTGWLRDHPGAVKVMAVAFAALGAAIMLSAIATIAMNLAFLASPVGAVVVAVIALGAAFVYAYTKIDWFRKAVDKVFDFVREHWLTMLGIMTGGLIPFVVLVVRKWGAIKNGFRAMAEAIVLFWTATISKVLWGFSKLMHAAGKMPGPLGAPFRAAADAIDTAKAKVDNLHDAIQKRQWNRKIQVAVEASVKFKVPNGISRVEELRFSGASGDIDAFDMALGANIRGAFPKRAVATFARPAGVSGVVPGLWDDIAAGAQYGVHLTSGFRPGAIVRGTNTLSRHATGRAIDMAGSAAAMKAYALHEAGQPGINHVIYSPIGIWTAGRGWGPIHSAITKADHYSHVHVDTFQKGGNVSAITKYFARGGFLRGVGRGDIIPAMLEPGEGIINRRAVAALGGPNFIDRVNQRWPRFQAGGIAGVESGLGGDGPYTMRVLNWDEGIVMIERVAEGAVADRAALNTTAERMRR